ncbi:hypothetical protein [Aureispira sp. CCB-QB1]|uniref:hypothetical protein n=1 Tax=Aureispira sp. CCB-QB1 TaxID=1313421 RepID=UPI00069794F6|nr:hypothetical protein [Aureispira sp. CCB-QB1]
MSSLIHTLSLTELKLYLVFTYTLVWYFLYNAFGFVAQNKAQQLKIITAFFYCLVPTTLSILLFRGTLNGEVNLSSAHIHFLLVIVSFYSFSTIEEFRIKSNYNWALIIHHIAFGLVILKFAISADIPSTWLWIVAVQFSSIFVSLRSILKSYPKLYKRFNTVLEEADFWTFLLVRMLFQTFMMLSAIYDMYLVDEYRYVLIAAFFLSMLLNIIWFNQIVAKKIRRNKKIFDKGLTISVL